MIHTRLPSLVHFKSVRSWADLELEGGEELRTLQTAFREVFNSPFSHLHAYAKKAVSAVLLFTFEDCKPIQSIQNGLNATLCPSTLGLEMAE